MTEEKPRNLSLIEKIKRWQELAEEIREPVSDDELKSLTEDIKDHIPALLKRKDIAEEDAKKLREEGNKLINAARQQENEAKRIKKYIIDALKMNEFDRVTFGRTKLQLIKKMITGYSRPATEADYRKNPEMIRVIPHWKQEPTVDDMIEHRDLIECEYQWNDAAVKKAVQVEPEKWESLVTKTPRFELRTSVKKETPNDDRTKEN